MPERIPDRFIVKQVERMVEDGMDVGLDGQYGQFRVTNVAGHTNLSPRAPNREISDWLDAYRKGWEAGLEVGKERQFNKMRKEGAADIEREIGLMEGDSADTPNGSGGT